MTNMALGGFKGLPSVDSSYKSMSPPLYLLKSNIQIPSVSNSYCSPLSHNSTTYREIFGFYS